MYKVCADDILIHSAVSPSDEVHLIDPDLKLQDSSAGTFSFTMSPRNVGYNDIDRFTTTIIVYKDDDIIWTGRVISESVDFWHRRKFNCEGALAFLNDSQQPLRYYSNINSDAFFRRLITNHNARVGTNRQFQVGSITQHNSYDPYEYKTDYKSTFETIKSELFDKLGGHLRVRYNGSDPTPIIDYLADYPNTSSQELNFGDNLLDFTKNWDLTNLCTVIIPRGKQLEEENSHGDREYLTIESVNNGSKYLQNTTAYNKYGGVERVVDFSDVEDARLLKQMGTNYLESTQFDEMTLNVSAVDLHLMNKSIVSFNLLDQVRCISKPHGLNRLFPITEIDIPLDKPDSVKYTMGNRDTASMTSQSVSTGRDFESQLNNELGSLHNGLLDVQTNATNIINSKTTGYVNIISENDISQALVITNTPDIETATKLWRWNLNGLGYLDMDDPNNPNHVYKLAITRDGSIVADFIHTGVIDDGHGYNYWDLDRGVFQMAYNTNIVNNSNDAVTFVDIINMTDSASISADKSLRRQYGAYNLLNGTNTRMVLSSGQSDWSKGQWDGLLGASATKRIIDVSGLPNSSLVKAFSIRMSNSNSRSPSYFTQRNVKISPDQVYVLSCYACCEGYSSGYTHDLKISIGKKALSNSDTIGFATATASIPLDNTWRRYTFTFMTKDISSWGNADTTAKKAGVSSGKTDVMFGFSSTSSSITCKIAGMTLERGNTATDWSDSVWDTSDFSTYTANQEVVKLNNTLNNIELFKRITSGNAAQGIYMTNGSLLINASYIRTGILDAKLIRTGTITDNSGKTIWDLQSSKLSTSNIVITGGAIKFGNVAMSSKGIDMGDNVIRFNGWSSYNSDYGYTGTSWKALFLGSKDGIEFVAPHIRVANKKYTDDPVNVRTGLTKNLHIETIQWIRNRGDYIEWQPQDIYIDIVNGIIVNVTMINSNFNNYNNQDIDFAMTVGE